jgi:hypothetical protein
MRAFTVCSKNPRHESATAIRAKSRIWRVPMRRDAGELENFFIAKNRDSESARRVFDRLRSALLLSIASSSSNARMSKTRAAQVFLAISTIVSVAFSRASRIVVHARCDVIDERASRVLASARQRFLKQDSVFSNVLVYSG